MSSGIKCDRIEIKYGGKEFRFQFPEQDSLIRAELGPMVAAIRGEVMDYNNVMILLMTALAKDVYARMPIGPRNFQELAALVKLRVEASDGQQFLVSQELEKP